MIDQRGDRLESGRLAGSGRNGDGGGGDTFAVSLSRLHEHGWSRMCETRGLDVNAWISNLGDWGRGSPVCAGVQIPEGHAGGDLETQSTLGDALLLFQGG